MIVSAGLAQFDLERAEMAAYLQGSAAQRGGRDAGFVAAFDQQHLGVQGRLHPGR